MDNPLSTSLLLNAVLSAATGVALTLAPHTISRWLGHDIAGWLRLFGLALIAHFALLLWVRTRPNLRLWTRINLATVAPYPLLLLGILMANIVSETPGRLLLTADAAAVAAVATLQWRGLNRLPARPNTTPA